MNEKQNLFLGAQVACWITNEDDFNKLVRWMTSKKLKRTEDVSVSGMKYPGNSGIAVYRDPETLFITWSVSPVIDGFKIAQIQDLVTDDVVVEVDPMEEVQEEKEVPQLVLDVQINTVTPAQIDSNIKTLKEMTIPGIQQYKKTVVTKDNFKEIDELLTRLRKGRDALNKGKIDTKKKAAVTIVEFEEDVKDILKAFDETITYLASQTDLYKTAEKEEKRKTLLAKIDSLRTTLIDKAMISKEFADKFVFDEKWLNKSTSQKAFLEAVESQFKNLMEQEIQHKENIATVKNAVEAQGLDGLLKVEKYLDLLERGTPLSEVVKIVTGDGISIQAMLTKEKEKAKEQAKQEVREEIKQEVTQEIKKELKQESVYEHTETVNIIPPTEFIDEKTGEYFGKQVGNDIQIRIQENGPTIDPNKLYKYTYEFEGDFASIKTFSLALKIISRINKTFKYTRK